MMQLKFQAGADEWVKGLCSDLSARVTILGLKFVGSGREVAHFVDITMEDEDTEGVRDWLRGSSSILSTELTDLSKRQAMGVVVARGCKACNSIMDSNSAMFVSSASTEQDCALTYKVFLNNDGVPTLLRHLTRDGVGYRVTNISPISPVLPLTSRQLSILKSAMEMGLYDFPRRITQDELAYRIGIKTSTLNEILRRAEKNILGRFLNEQSEAEA
jgi:predicted DNA binding protein